MARQSIQISPGCGSLCMALMFFTGLSQSIHLLRNKDAKGINFHNKILFLRKSRIRPFTCNPLELQAAYIVDPVGFEPTASGLQGRRSPS